MISITFLRRSPMEQPKWFVHMDERWMWRWLLTDGHGRMLAMSEGRFFLREDAVQNLNAARMALTGL
jgi:hypothetical protein